MNNRFLELISKIRYELLGLSGETAYASHLFHYFNSLYHNHNAIREERLNPAASLKSRNGLEKTSINSVNAVFEKVFLMLRDNIPIEKDASADLMLLYSIGFNVKYELRELNESNKQLFFHQVIAQYNAEFHSHHTSMETLYLNSRKGKDDEWY